MVMPLLFLLIVGIVDFGFLFQSFEVVTNAVREGARLRILPGYNDDDAKSRVNDYCTTGGLPNGCPPANTAISQVTITPAGGGPPFQAVQVSHTYTHNFLFIGPIVSLFYSLSFQPDTSFTVVSTMRPELVAAP